MRLNICFVYKREFSLYRGGVEKVTLILAESLIKRGHKVVFLNNIKTNNSLGKENIGVEQYYFPNPTPDTSENYEYYKKFLKEKDINIVINQGALFPEAKLYCSSKDVGIPCINVIHGNPSRALKHLPYYICRLRNNTLAEKFKRIARCLLIYKFIIDYKKYLVNQYSLLCSGRYKIVLLSNTFIGELQSINKSIKPIIIPNPLSFNINRSNGKEKIILWVGRMDLDDKRPDRMIKIWGKIYKNYPDWKLIMIGGGYAKEKIVNLSKGIDRIEFTGFVDPLQYFEKAEIICMTSTTEGFGMVLIEGLSQGVIPMAFESFLSVRDTIKSESQLVKPFSINEYAKKLKELMSNEKKRQELRHQGYEIAKNFEKETICDKWEDLFKRVIEEKGV